MRKLLLIVIMVGLLPLGSLAQNEPDLPSMEARPIAQALECEPVMQSASGDVKENAPQPVVAIQKTSDKQSSACLQYIATYAAIAQEQMALHGIPASITLAQGLLESGAGRSVLAKEANNHFGIKVGSTWDGPYLLRDDDKPNEKFRKYGSARDSFEDHSLVLSRERYKSLLELEKTDYKGWAVGLKRCGYATSSTYAQKLIKIIELYELQKFDTLDTL